jgi:hypothetical protein
MQAPPIQTKSETTLKYLDDIRAVLSAVGLILAPKMSLFLSLLGGFVLGVMAVSDPQPMKLVASGIYDLLIFLPVVYMNVTKG